MKYRISVGLIGWIDPNGPWPILVNQNGDDNSWLAKLRRGGIDADQAVQGMPQRNWWIIKTYLGLMATTNRPPAKQLSFPAYRATRDFRAMVWAELEFDEGAGATGSVKTSFVGSPALGSIVDPGYTPPVDVSKVGAMLMLEDALEARDYADTMWKIEQIFDHYRNHKTGPLQDLPYPPGTNAHTLAHLRDRTWYPGEASPLSGLRLDHPHSNSILGNLPPGERFIAGGLMRFRAGPHTDQVGIEDAEIPYHVPWVWAEFRLTYLGQGRVRLQGASSIFPTVAWYVDDKRVEPPHRQVGDLVWSQPLGWVHPQSLNIWPVLSVGAKGGKEPSARAEVAFAGQGTPVTSLPYTCPGGRWIDQRFVARRV